MEDFIKHSFSINFISRSIKFINNKFKESSLYYFLEIIGERIKACFTHSSIWNYLKGPDYLDNIWKKSIFRSILNKLFNGPPAFFRTSYEKHQNIFDQSYGFKFLNLILNQFVFIIGLVLIIIVNIPDHKWYNIYGVLFVTLLAFLFFMRTIIKPNNTIDIGDFDFTFIMFFVAIIMSTITSLFPWDSLNYFIYYLISIIMMVIIVSSINNIEDLNRIIELIIIGVFITALYGIWQWKIVGIDVNPSLTDIKINQGMSGRVFSTMGNPNIYGELLVLIIPLFFVAILNAKKLWKKYLFTVISIPVIIILFKTGSRSSWVSFAFSFLVFVFFKNKKLLPLMIVAGILAIPMVPPTIYKRILTLFNPNDTSVKYRKEILKPAIAMFKNYWFNGVGLGNKVFYTIYKRYESSALQTVSHTHNLYLQIWLESGIVAIVSFVWLILRLVKKSSILIFSKKNNDINNILIGSISSIAGLTVMGFADHIWFYNRILFMFWIVIALIFSAFKLSNKQISV